MNYDIGSVFIKGNSGDDVQWIYADKEHENHELRVINQFDEYDPYKGIMVIQLVDTDHFPQLQTESTTDDEDDN